MAQRTPNPGPPPPRTRPHPSDPRTQSSVREGRIRALKAKIRGGSYDADTKIDSLIDEVVRDAL